MVVLHVYQTGLLKELVCGEGPMKSEVHQVADLALRPTKKTAHTFSRTMGALVATERQSDGDKDKIFPLDALISPKGLFFPCCSKKLGLSTSCHWLQPGLLRQEKRLVLQPDNPPNVKSGWSASS